MGKPEHFEVRTRTGEVPTAAGAPRYLVFPIDAHEINPRLVTDKIYLIDFGEAYATTTGDLPENLGIPMPYRSPELILDKAVGTGCDLWALACTLYEFRTGDELFNCVEHDPEEFLYQMVMLLGIFPEPWWSTTWKDRRDTFEDEPDENGYAVKVAALREDDPRQPKTGWTRTTDRSLLDALSPLPGHYPPFVKPKDIPHRTLDGRIEILADLLSQMMNFDPEKRLTASAAQDHEWFRLQKPENEDTSEDSGSSDDPGSSRTEDSDPAAAELSCDYSKMSLEEKLSDDDYW